MPQGVSLCELWASKKSVRPQEWNVLIHGTGTGRAPPPLPRKALFSQPNTSSSQWGWRPLSPWITTKAFDIFLGANPLPRLNLHPHLYLTWTGIQYFTSIHYLLLSFVLWSGERGIKTFACFKCLSNNTQFGQKLWKGHVCYWALSNISKAYWEKGVWKRLHFLNVQRIQTFWQTSKVQIFIALSSSEQQLNTCSNVTQTDSVFFHIV